MKIDKEFAELIPPLTEEEYKGLEASLLAEGCRDALVVWNGILIDGHNRYKICTEHSLAFRTAQKEFEDRDEAKLWIMKNQLSRRNLNGFQRIEIVRKCEEAVKAQAKKRQGTRNDLSTCAEYYAQVKGENDFPTFPQSYTEVETNSARGKTKEKSKEKRASDTLGAMAGVSGSTYEHATEVLDNAPEEVVQAVRKGDISINKAYTDMKKAKKKAERKKAIEEATSKPKTSSYVDIFTTDKKYRVIYADPAWSYDDKQDTEKLGGAVKHYPTMPLEEICALPVPTEKNAVLFLWTTSPMLEDAFKVINAWGFKYKSSFVWDKISHAMGHYNSVRHEFLLVCVKGSCTPDVAKLYDSVVSIERTEHSRKPEYFRQMIDTLYPVGERLEMFAREASEGWDVWGNMA